MNRDDSTETDIFPEAPMDIMPNNGSSTRKCGTPSKGVHHTLGVLFVAALMGCGTINPMPCGGDERFAAQELVYFGADTPSGHVTPEVWAQFLGEIVTPRFPEGLSVWQASGQWRSTSGQIIQEPSYVLSLVHPDNPTSNKAIQDIVASYKTRFQQEAVLRVKAYTCVSP